ncbi:hypothetical protein M6B38_235580 [Iris pallida]|uniref:Uncharacterized protein n=1 Tax=Iris pallida TaxID=29817 RepID=A0AAX6DP55_IRIPA|nr:hypothetical protein M6B38_235580 [Iris pallida]
MSKPKDFTKQRDRIPEQGNAIFINCLNNFIRMRKKNRFEMIQTKEVRDDSINF